MKKIICFVILFVTMLTCGITLLLPKTKSVEAEVVGMDMAQIVLTGYNGKTPESYFTNSNGVPTFSNAQVCDPSKSYIDKKGEKSSKFKYITGKHTSAKDQKSSGFCEFYPTLEMKKVISAGQLMVKAGCGLLALNDKERSKVDITIQIFAGGMVAKTMTFTSDKVSTNDDVFEPDWVETSLVELPTDTEKIVYSFQSREATNRSYAAKFCMFEPTLYFATNLSECKIENQDQSIKAGQVVKLCASNFITEQNPSIYYFEYYQKIHKISFEVTQGKTYAKIVGNYLYVNSDIPFGKKIVVRAKCRKSSLSSEYIYSKEVTFTFDIESMRIVVEKDFENPAKIVGEGDYFVGDHATLSVQPCADFEFVGWEFSGAIVSTEKSYTFVVEKNQTIKAKFTKHIKISKIVVKSKYYDGTTSVEFENIVLDGAQSSHDVNVELAAKFATSNVGKDKKIEFLSNPILVGDDAQLYDLDSFVPSVTASINQKSLNISAHKLSKVYGDSDPVLTFDATGLVEGEQVFGKLSRNDGEDAGEYGIYVGNLISQNPNYKINYVGNVFEIQKREIVLNGIGVSSKTYDKNSSAQIFATYQNVVSGDDVSVEFEAAFDNANAGTNKTVVISKITILGKNAKNYYINQQNLTFFGAITPKIVYVDSNEQTFTYGEDINIQYSAQGLLGDDELIGGLAISSNQVGSYVVSVGTLQNPNYEIVLNAKIVHVVPKSIVVSAVSSTKEYGDPDPTLSHVVTGLVGGDTLGGNVVREAGEDVGKYEIGIGTLHNDNYKIEFESADFEITKRSLQINILIADKIYDGTTNVVFTHEIKNALEDDNVEVEILLEFEDSNVGSGKTIIPKIEIIGENKSKYVEKYDKSLFFASIMQKNVEIISNSTTKTYGEKDPELKVDFVGVVEGEKILGKLSRFSGEIVGEYQYEIPDSMKIQNQNYSLCLKQPVTLTIRQKRIDLEIECKQKQFGDTDPEIAYIFDEESFVFGDSFESVVTGVAKRQGGEDVGRYRYEIGSMSFGKNYEINFVSGGALTICKREVVVHVEDVEKIYGDNDPTFSMTNENFVVGISSTLRLKREKGEDVGTYRITYESLDDPHYNITFNCGELTILPRKISVKVEDSFKNYGESDPVFDFVLYSGTLEFDDELASILSGMTSRDEGEDVGEYQIHQGTLMAAGNYDMTFLGGTLSIFEQELIIRFDDVSKSYGDKDPTFGFSIESGNIGTQTFSGKAKRQAGENVGQYEIDIGTLSISSNFKVRHICGTLTILPRQIEVSALPASKVYGEEDPEFDYVVTSGSLVDESDLVGTLYRENVGVKIYENVGKYSILSTLFNPNYEISYKSAQLSILQREIVVVSKDCKTVYGEPVLTSFEYELQGNVISGDTLTGGLYWTGGKDAGVYPIRCNVNLGRNYKVKYDQVNYEILPKQIVVTLGEGKKIYSNPDPMFSLQILEGALIDDDVLDWEVQRDDCENVGKYELTAVSLNTNYSLKTKNSVLEIVKKDVKLNLDVLDKPFDGTRNCKIKNPIVSGLVDNEIVLQYDKGNCAMFESVLPANNVGVELLEFWLEGENAGNYNLIYPTGLCANITHSSLESQNVEISTQISTSMKYGTTLTVKNLDIGDTYDGKKVLQGMSVGLLDKDGNNIVPNNALNMKIEIKNLSDCNNIRVFAKNSEGEYVELGYQISGDCLLVSTSNFSDFVVVCDNELWIDIALAVSVGLLLGVALCYVVLDMKKNKNKQK